MFFIQHKDKMRKHLIYIISAVCLAALSSANVAQAQSLGNIQRKGTTCRPAGNDIVLKTTFVLDSLRMGSNRQMVVTPVLEGRGGQIALFRPLMINGRRQHIYYQRNGNKRYPDAMEVRYEKGKAQSVDYLESLPYEEWMDGAGLRFATDTAQDVHSGFLSDPHSNAILPMGSPRLQYALTIVIQGLELAGDLHRYLSGLSLLVGHGWVKRRIRDATAAECRRLLRPQPLAH